VREFANRGRACHCGNTAFRTKSDLRESAVIGGGGKFKDVAADWIFLAHAQGSVVQLSGMAGVLEVVQELGRIHALILTCETVDRGSEVQVEFAARFWKRDDYPPFDVGGLRPGLVEILHRITVLLSVGVDEQIVLGDQVIVGFYALTIRK